MSINKSIFGAILIILALLLLSCGAEATTPTSPPNPTPVTRPTLKPQLPTPTYGLAGPTPSGGQRADKTIDLKGCCPHGISWSPDSKILVTGFKNNVQLLNLDGSSGAVFSGHTADVTDVSWSADGKLIASASADTTARIWTADGKLVKNLNEDTDRLSNLSWSKDSQLLATASADGNVLIWQTDGIRLSTLMLMSNSTDMSTSPPVQSISWKADNFTLAISSGKTIDLEHVNMRVAGSISVGSESNRVAWSPDGKKIASAGADKAVRIWTIAGELANPQTGSVAGVLTPTLQTTLAGHTAEVLSVAWSPDSQLLASGSVDHTIRIWNKDGKLLVILTDHTSAVNSLAWSPDGMFLASASDDGTVRLWKIKK